MLLKYFNVKKKTKWSKQLKNVELEWTLECRRAIIIATIAPIRRKIVNCSKRWIN